MIEVGVEALEELAVSANPRSTNKIKRGTGNHNRRNGVLRECRGIDKPHFFVLDNITPIIGGSRLAVDRRYRVSGYDNRLD